MDHELQLKNHFLLAITVTWGGGQFFCASDTVAVVVRTSSPGGATVAARSTGATVGGSRQSPALLTTVPYCYYSLLYIIRSLFLLLW